MKVYRKIGVFMLQNIDTVSDVVSKAHADSQKSTSNSAGCYRHKY